MAAINPALLAQGQHTQGFDVGGALGSIAALRYAKTRNALADLQLQEYQSPLATQARESALETSISENELKSVVYGARDLLPHVWSGDWGTVHSKLIKRRERLTELGIPADQMQDTLSGINAVENILSGPRDEQTGQPLDTPQSQQFQETLEALVTNGQEMLASGNRTAEMKNYAQLQSLKRRYGPDSTEVQDFWDVFRQNYGWQRFGEVPLPVSQGPGGPRVGGRPATGAGAPDLTALAASNQETVDRAGARGAGLGEADADISTATPVAVAKTEADIISKLPQTVARAGATINELDDGLRKAGQAIQLTGDWEAGYSGALTALVFPESDSAQLRRTVFTLQSQQILNNLAQMRELSANGASGLGNTNEAEINALMSKIANLDPNASAEDLRKSLVEIADRYSKIRAATFVSIRLANGEFGDLSDPGQSTRALADARAIANGIYMRPPITGEYAKMGDRMIAALQDGSWIYVDNGEAVE